MRIASSHPSAAKTTYTPSVHQSPSSTYVAIITLLAIRNSAQLSTIFLQLHTLLASTTCRADRSYHRSSPNRICGCRTHACGHRTQACVALRQVSHSGWCRTHANNVTMVSHSCKQCLHCLQQCKQDAHRSSMTQGKHLANRASIGLP